MSALLPIETANSQINFTTPKGDSAMSAINSRSIEATNLAANDNKPVAGIKFAKFAMAIGAAKGNLPHAHAIALDRYPFESDVITSLKAAISAGSTTNPDYQTLVPGYRNIAGDFIEHLRNSTIIGAFGRGNVPSLRHVDFRTAVPRQLNGGSAAWVREGHAKPLTNFSFDLVTLDFAKIAAISVITQELLRFSSPSAELLVRDSLTAAVVETLDSTFINSAIGPIEGERPGSVLFGVEPLQSSGQSDSDAIRADVRRIIGVFLAAKNSIKQAVWILPTALAFALSIATNPLGQREFPQIELTGGVFFGIPVIVSDHVPANTVAIVDAASIFIADDNTVTVDVSDSASLQMDSAPTMNAVSPLPTATVNLWQTNAIAFRAERFVTFEKARVHAAQHMQNVFWASEAIAS